MHACEGVPGRGHLVHLWFFVRGAGEGIAVCTIFSGDGGLARGVVLPPLCDVPAITDAVLATGVPQAPVACGPIDSRVSTHAGDGLALR